MVVKTPQKTKKSQPKAKKEISLPLEKENFVIISIGILFLIVGYIFMSENSVDGFLPTVIAPILLVLGYCVIIPYGIIKKPSRLKKVGKGAEIGQNVAVSQQSQSEGGGVSSNIKTS
jgi:uncharacterized protein with PQ loop repeat